MNKTYRRFASALWLAACTSTVGAVDSPGSGLSVDFTDCVESIGVGLIATDSARELVPSGFVLVGEGGLVTPIVVRTADCGGVSVDGHPSKAGKVVQIGAVVFPPDFTGDINNYTLCYYTSNGELAGHLRARGVRAQHVQRIGYEYEPGKNGVPSALNVAVPRPGRPPLRIEGTVAESVIPAGSFNANWWVQTHGGSVKMHTSVPTIYIGGADLLLSTHPGGPLGQLIGGDTLDFPLLQQFNTFPNAHMEVGVSP